MTVRLVFVRCCPAPSISICYTCLWLRSALHIRGWLPVSVRLTAWSLTIETGNTFTSLLGLTPIAWASRRGGTFASLRADFPHLHPFSPLQYHSKGSQTHVPSTTSTYPPRTRGTAPVITVSMSFFSVCMTPGLW